MNYTIRFTILLSIIAFAIQYSCKSVLDNEPPEKIVSSYIEGLNNSDIRQISKYLSDSIRMTEGGFILLKTKDEYYKHFKWDSVFSPKYTLISTKTVNDNSVEITLSKFCKRIQFLHDSATIYTVLFDICKGKITKIENGNLIVFDTVKWESRRDTLVAWIDENHPYLTGFTYDQTEQGAQNYLKAIELSENKK